MLSFSEGVIPGQCCAYCSSIGRLPMIASCSPRSYQLVVLHCSAVSEGQPARGGNRMGIVRIMASVLGKQGRGKLYSAAIAVLLCGTAGASGIDHRWNKDDSGIWKRSNQNVLRYGAPVLDLGLALYEGDGSRLGRAAWQSVDSVVLSTVVAETGKRVFGRVRPSETDNPNQWFKGGRSFPSGEVAEISGIVTPYVLEYRREQPLVYAL